MKSLFKKRTIQNPDDIDDQTDTTDIKGEALPQVASKRSRVDDSRRYGKMNVDQIVGLLATKPDPEGFYESLKNKGCVIDSEATEEVLRDMGYEL